MNDSLPNFSLMMEAMTELEPEIQAAQTMPVAAGPSLAESLSRMGPLPRESLFLGLASDGLPVLLNLHNAHPGPLLIAADPGAGKTALLQMIARAAAHMHKPSDVQFGIVTKNPDEWESLAKLEHCVGVLPTYHKSAADYLSSLSGWAHGNKRKNRSILLLVDDLESMLHLEQDARQSLRWLLLRGPARRVWPIVTLNTERVAQVEEWLEAFRTRVFGHVQDGLIAEGLTGLPDSPLRDLQAGQQFALREGSDWLKFRIPDVG